MKGNMEPERLAGDIIIWWNREVCQDTYQCGDTSRGTTSNDNITSLYFRYRRHSQRSVEAPCPSST